LQCSVSEVVAQIGRYMTVSNEEGYDE